MLYQKMRPYRFDDMVGQKVVVENIRSQIMRNSWFQVYILGGQFGSGKTTMARIITLAINCENRDEKGNPCLKCTKCRAILQNNSIDFREIDGASNTGVNHVRELTEWMQYKPSGKWKVVIIDEVHMLSTPAFNSLLKILEDPPAYAVFILCTTDVDAILDTVQSRSACYTFAPIPEELIASHVEFVARENRIAIQKDAAFMIAQASSGSMRNALKLLEQLSVSGNEITLDLCQEVLGIPQEQLVFDLLEAYLEGDLKKLMELTDQAYEKGFQLYALSRSLIHGSVEIMEFLCGCHTQEFLDDRKKGLDRFAKIDLNRVCLLSEKLMLLRNSMKTCAEKAEFLMQSITIISELEREKLEAAIPLSREEYRLEMDKIWNAVKELRSGHGGINQVLPQTVGCQNQPADVTNEEAGETDHEDTLTDLSKSDFVIMSDPGSESGMENIPFESDREALSAENREEISGHEEFFDDVWIEDDEPSDFTPGYQKSVALSTFAKEDTVMKEAAAADRISNKAVSNASDDRTSGAEEYEALIEQMAAANPEVEVHFRMCKRKYTKEGLTLVAPDPSICKVMLLYLARAGVKDISVTTEVFHP